MIKKLQAIIQELEQFLPKADINNNAISTGSVGWHIEHTYLATIKIISAVLKSDHTKFTQKFNFIRSVILLTKTIPRGKGKAPKEVQAQGATAQEMEQLIKKTFEKIALLEQANAHQYFPHPYFGNLNKKQTIKFLIIHTNHHLKIIKDILK